MLKNGQKCPQFRRFNCIKLRCKTCLEKKNVILKFLKIESFLLDSQVSEFHAVQFTVF